MFIWAALGWRKEQFVAVAGLAALWIYAARIWLRVVLQDACLELQHAQYGLLTLWVTFRMQGLSL
jgi:hypothetical protein